MPPAPAVRGTLRPALRPAHWPWWVQVLAVHGAARVVSAVILIAVAGTQAANPWTDAAPSYPHYAGLMWDGSWYRTIAETGYPDGLPVGADGRVVQNAWAFFPLFPILARALMGITGAPWHVVAPTLALVLSGLAMLVVHQLVDAATGRAAIGPAAIARAATGRAATRGPAGIAEPVRRALPLVTVAVLTTFASAPVLQVAYTESLALLLLAGALWCLVRRQYLLAVPVVIALGLTRAVALPVAVAVLAHAVVRLRRSRAGAAPWPRRERVELGVLAAATVGSGLLWPAFVGWATGVPGAYTQTQAAWRGRGEVVPLVPWFDVARWLVGGWGPALVLVVVGLLVLAVVSRPATRMGPELHAWTAGYLAYLVGVLEPGTSLVRFLLLAFPLAGAIAQVALHSRWPRTALAVVLLLGVVGQVAWVGLLWRLVPPSGWPP